MQKKHFGLFLAMVALSVLLMGLQSRWGNFRPLWFFSIALDNINTSITAVYDTMAHTRDMLTMRDSEIQKLRKEIRILSLRSIRYSEVVEENRRLRGLLDMQEKRASRDIIARVVSRGSDHFTSTLVINKGSDELVEKDMTVITSDGLLGKVYRVTPRNAVVMLLDDSRFSVAVRLQQSREEAILSGAGQGRCMVKYLSTDKEVPKGDSLVSSGLDELFPQGIPVGSITKVSTDEKELFHRVEAVPFVNARQVEEVVVLLQ